MQAIFSMFSSSYLVVERVQVLKVVQAPGLSDYRGEDGFQVARWSFDTVVDSLFAQAGTLVPGGICGISGAISSAPSSYARRQVSLRLNVLLREPTMAS